MVLCKRHNAVFIKKKKQVFMINAFQRNTSPTSLYGIIPFIMYMFARHVTNFSESS